MRIRDMKTIAWKTLQDGCEVKSMIPGVDWLRIRHESTLNLDPAGGWVLVLSGHGHFRSGPALVKIDSGMVFEIPVEDKLIAIPRRGESLLLLRGLTETPQAISDDEPPSAEDREDGPGDTIPGIPEAFDPFTWRHRLWWWA